MERKIDLSKASTRLKRILDAGNIKTVSDVEAEGGVSGMRKYRQFGSAMEKELELLIKQNT